MFNNLKFKLVNSTLSWLGGQKYLSMQMDITNACNLSCTHCYHSDHKNKGAISFDGWVGVLDQYEALLNKLYLKPAITICGGEPLVSPYLLPLLENINTRFPGVNIQILTNGTKINESLLMKLKKYNISFQVSMDGPNAETHDLKRGQGSFEKALAGLRLARKHNFQTWILSVLSRETSLHLDEYFMLAKNVNASAMNFTRLIPVGYGENLVNRGQDDILLGEDLKNAMTSIVKLSKKHGVYSNTDQPLYHLIDPKLGKNGKYGFQGLVVDYKGNLKVSSRIDFKLGSVIDDGLENLFLNHPVMKNLRAGKVKGCGSCKFQSRCGGDRNMSYAVTGNFLSQDIGCWLKPNTLEREGA